MSLGMRERLGLQKSVKQNLATLRGGEVGMRERLSLQKQIKADLAKLGGEAPTEAPAHERIKAALDAGDASEAMQIAQSLRPDKEGERTAKQVVMAELLRAGLKVAGNSVPEMLAHAWPQMQEKAGGGDSDAPAENQTAAARYHMENLNLYVATHGTLPFPGSPNTEEGEAGMQMMQLIEAVKEPGVEGWLRENYNPNNLLDRALAYKGGGRATVSNLPAAAVEPSELPDDVTPKSGQVVMNAQRPIAGHQTSEGPSINGRHYAIIDLASDDAQSMVEQNRKLDAVVLVTASQEAIEAAAIARMPYRYRSRLDTVGEQARKSQVQKYVSSLRNETMPHSELVALLGSDTGAPAGGTPSSTPDDTGEAAAETNDTTLTSQAARGDFNGLGLPEFIDKLKEAYSADEDLEGAKTAASGYLEANRDELEAA